MGLDQWAYVAERAGELELYYSELREADWDENRVTRQNPRKIAQWRKHPNLHGWMEQLWLEHDVLNKERVFNGVELELTSENLDRLEEDIKSGKMAALDNAGFFFGSPSDGYYQSYDLEFVREARFNLFMGLKVFYNSSW